MYKNREDFRKKMSSFQAELMELRDKVNAFIVTEFDDRLKLQESYDNIHERISAQRNRIDKFVELDGIDSFWSESTTNISDYNIFSMQNSVMESKLNQRYFALIYNLNDKELTENIDKNNELFANEIDKLDNKLLELTNVNDEYQKNIKFQLEDLKKEQNNFREQMKEVENLKNNLFNFFGLIVGLLAFIFVNYQFISSAKDLGMGKMLMFMGIANVGIILGIIIILGFLAHILDKEDQIKKMVNALKSISFFVAILLILVGGYVIYQREDKPKEQAEKIKMENINDKFVGLEQKINNLLDENTTKTEKIKELQSEIDTLKNKK